MDAKFIKTIFISILVLFFNLDCSMSNKEIGDGFWQHHLGNMDILEYEAKYTAGRGVTTNDVKEILVRNFAGKLTNISRVF